MPSTSACNASPHPTPQTPTLVHEPPFHLTSLLTATPFSCNSFIYESLKRLKSSRNRWVLLFHNLLLRLSKVFVLHSLFNGLGSNLELNLIIIKVFPLPRISRRTINDLIWHRIPACGRPQAILDLEPHHTLISQIEITHLVSFKKLN